MGTWGILTGLAAATVAISLPGTSQAATPPDAPSITGVERAGDGAAKVSFALAQSGPEATSVHVTANPGGKWCTAHIPAKHCTVSGLNNGKTYTFTAIASAKGNSTASDASEPLLVARKPYRPLKAVAAVQPGGLATLSWTPGDDGGLPVTGYRVTSPAGAGCTTDSATTSCSFSDLKPGTRYLFSVVAINDAGTSFPTSANRVTAQPEHRPGPGIVTRAEVIGDGQIRVWAVPGQENGAPVSLLVVRVSGHAKSCGIDLGRGQSCTIVGLRTGLTYGFHAEAYNKIGKSKWSPEKPAVPTFVAWFPSRPRNVTPTAQADGTALVTWTKPYYDGGLPITNYTATATPGGATCSAAAEMQCTLAGLEPGLKYDVTMTSTNAWGSSPTTQPARVVLQ